MKNIISGFLLGECWRTILLCIILCTVSDVLIFISEWFQKKITEWKAESIILQPPQHFFQHCSVDTHNGNESSPSGVDFRNISPWLHPLKDVLVPVIFFSSLTWILLDFFTIIPWNLLFLEIWYWWKYIVLIRKFHLLRYAELSLLQEYQLETQKSPISYLFFFACLCALYVPTNKLWSTVYIPISKASKVLKLSYKTASLNYLYILYSYE